MPRGRPAKPKPTAAKKTAVDKTLSGFTNMHTAATGGKPDRAPPASNFLAGFAAGFTPVSTPAGNPFAGFTFGEAVADGAPSAGVPPAQVSLRGNIFSKPEAPEFFVSEMQNAVAVSKPPGNQITATELYHWLLDVPPIELTPELVAAMQVNDAVLNDDGEPAHALFSASGSKAWGLCSAKLALELGIADEPDQYSLEGTQAHALREAILRSRVYKTELDVTPWPSADMRRDMLHSADRCMEFYRPDAALVGIESRVHFGPALGLRGQFGTSDWDLIVGDTAIVEDLKYGGNPLNKISAVKNPQSFCYLVGLMLDNPQKFVGVTRFIFIIDQPRLGHYDKWEGTFADVQEFVTEYREKAKRAAEMLLLGRAVVNAPDAAYTNPSRDACQFCRAKPICLGFSSYVSNVVADDFKALDTPDKPVVLADPSSLGSRVLGHKLDNATMVEMWLKAIRAQGEREALAGNPPIGRDGPYKLVRGKRSDREWLDEEATLKALKEVRLKHEEIYKYTLISPTGAEELFKDRPPKQWEKVQACIAPRRQGGLSLAPATDKRSDASSGIDHDDFQEVTADGT